MFFFSTYNIQVFENNVWKLILKHDLKSVEDAYKMLDDCFKLDPEGTYQIVEHLN